MFLLSERCIMLVADSLKFTRIIIVIDGDWKLLGVLHNKPFQELHYEGSGTATNLQTMINMCNLSSSTARILILCLNRRQE